MSPRRAWPNVPVLVVACMGLALALVVNTHPMSAWLVRLTPDGSLNPETVHFLDSLGLLFLPFSLALVAIAISGGLRSTLTSAWSRGVSPSKLPSRWCALFPAVLAAAVRLAVSAFGDVGLGDDGARVTWLKLWLLHPNLAWDGLWAPGHLYLHALVWLVTRDPVRAGVILSVAASAGTVWLLARSVARDWGNSAGVVAGACVALLPVSVAFGSTPDVNPVFAFLIVAAIAGLQHYTRAGRARWLLISWLCMAFAAWSRFESFLLVPGVAIVLWPRWRLAVVFAVACLLPTVAWNAILYFHSGDALRVVNSVRSSYRVAAWKTEVFTFAGSAWVGFTLPFMLLGCMGIVRALRARRGRAWLAVLVLHTGALAASTLTAGQGTQPRYLILAGSILAAYAGVALGGMLERSRVYGVALLISTGLLLAWTPPMYPAKWDLWIRRSPPLRAVVDRVAALGTGKDVLWIADEAAFFYPCRLPIPIERYHAMSRADSDPALTAHELEPVNEVVACVRETETPRRLWSSFLQHSTGEWNVAPSTSNDGYSVYLLTRVRPHSDAPARGPDGRAR